MEQHLNRQLLAFLDASPSCYHAVANVAAELENAGYKKLPESRKWELTPGGAYYVVRGESSIIAFRIPVEAPNGFMLAAAHSDSPTYKVREQAVASSAGGTVRLAVEPYGGMIARSWMDRPLSVAGRVVVREDSRIMTRLVDIDRDLCIIPSVAIHLNRSVNQGVELKANVDMLPLLGCGQVDFRGLLAEAAGVKQEDILSTELFLYPRMKGTLLGAEQELVASGRLDDLQSVFGCMKGFLAAEASGSVPVLAVFNNEEVGSNSLQGADSTFLTDVLERICDGIGADYRAMVSGSFMVSADNAHAIHPAHPELSDPAEHPVLNGGIVIKYNANQKYTTDGLSAAVFGEVCRAANVPVQRYSNRADLPGGSTLGNISTAHLSIPSVDIGLPQLAMHSCYEVAGAKDTEYLVQAMKEYFGRSIRCMDDGSIQI